MLYPQRPCGLVSFDHVVLLTNVFKRANLDGVEVNALAAGGVPVFCKSQPCCSARCLDFFDPVFRSCHRRACGCH